MRQYSSVEHQKLLLWCLKRLTIRLIISWLMSQGSLIWIVEVQITGHYLRELQRFKIKRIELLKLIKTRKFRKKRSNLIFKIIIIIIRRICETKEVAARYLNWLNPRCLIRDRGKSPSKSLLYSGHYLSLPTKARCKQESSWLNSWNVQ